VTAGLVLAAGAGLRFGAPKQLALLHGQPLLAHVIGTARAVLDPVVVVLGAHAGDILASMPVPGAIVCDDWQAGQSASLRAGVAALAGHDEVMVLLGDQPLLTPLVIHGTLGLQGHDAARPTYDGVPGHPVLLGPRVLAAVADLRGDVGARDLLSRFRVRTWEAGHLADPTDIDTPDQLEALR
jgi:CTP:molybdopterin cytidylyltransferase MocA